MRQFYVMLVALATFSGSARAQTPATTDSMSAAKLYAICTQMVEGAPSSKELADLKTICTVYFRGLTDGMFIMQSLANKGMKTCLPTDTPTSIVEAQAIFQSYLKKNPQSAQNSAGLIAAMSLVLAHPCK